MSQSPRNLLFSRQELIKWQESQEYQQEKLLKQQNQRLVQSEGSYSSDSIYETIKGLSAFDSSSTSTPEKSANYPSTMNFYEKAGLVGGESEIAKKPIQPFLRKGSGLVRYRMNPDEHRPFTKTPNRNKSINRKAYPQLGVDSNEKKLSIESSCRQNLDTATELTPLKKPTVGIIPNARWCNATEKNLESNDKILNWGMSDNSGEIVQLKQPLLLPTLSNFTLKTSNTTNSGTIRRNTVLAAKEDVAIRINEFAARKLALPRQQACASNQENERFSEIQHRTSNEPEKTMQPNYEHSDTPGELTMYENENLKELEIFERLEQRAINSSFGSTNSSIRRLFSSIPTKTSTTDIENNCDLTDTNAKHVRFDHDVNKLRSNEDGNASPNFKPMRYSSSNSSVNSDDLKDMDNDTSSNSSLNSTLSREENKQTIQDPRVQEKMMCDVGTTTSPIEDVDYTHIPEIEERVERKMQELDRKIQSFQNENPNIARLKSELENQKREMNRERKELQRQLEDEKIRVNHFLEEEKKKLARERMVFERYVKDQQNMPSKKERAEISMLKTELQDVKETLKLKATRNGMSQARLRNQIKTLEKEIDNLKKEVENLNKQNAKLRATQQLSRKPSDTKMLHEINKNISKLTKDAKAMGRIKRNSLEKRDSLTSSEEEETSLRKMSSSKLRNSKITYKLTSPRNQVLAAEEAHEIGNKPVGSDFPVDYGNARQRIYNSPTLEQGNNNLYEYKMKYKEDAVVTNENDKNYLNTDNLGAQCLQEVERKYDKMFNNSCSGADKLGNCSSEESKTSYRRESSLPDGGKEIKYSNGNTKMVSADGNVTIMKYVNGDIKEINSVKGIILYYYANKTKQTTYADGSELLEFPNGTIEKRYKDGTKEERYGDGAVARTLSDGTKITTLLDGTVVTVTPCGKKTMLFTNGHKEIHTEQDKRREHPDGTVKILYPDGSTETRYANGRIRMRDKDGVLFMDSHAISS